MRLVNKTEPRRAIFGNIPTKAKKPHPLILLHAEKDGASPNIQTTWLPFQLYTIAQQ
jgi:hypothetical protein